jgi:serine/threonine protein kinase
MKVDKCNYCFDTFKKIGEGGNSYLYKTVIGDDILIRTIPITNGWKEIKNEILLNNFITDLTSTICPHFPKTHDFTVCKKFNVVHQTIEKFDGDISKINNVIRNDNANFIQLLTSVFCLMRKGIRHNDVKEQNILYKKFLEERVIVYKLDNKFFSIKTNIFLVLSDFGKSGKYPEIKGKFEVNPCMNMRDTLCLLKLFGKKYENYFCENITFNDGVRITKELLLKELSPYEIYTSPLIFYDLDVSLPDFNSKGFINCFYKKLIDLYNLF